MREKVVITGMGAVTPLGLSIGSFWNGLIEGRSGVGPVTRFDASLLKTRIAAELKGFDPTQYMDGKLAKRTDPFTQYAIAASTQAVEHSGLDCTENRGERIGVIIGSGIGGTTTWEGQHRALVERGPDRVSPFFVPMMIADMAAGQVSMVHGAWGFNYATVSACASGAHAIGEAFRLVRYGEQDAVLGGGSEAPVTPLAMAGFCSLRAMSTRNEEPERASRPFERDRDGFIMGEGAAILVLESETHAKARGAKIYAELAGYGATADAHHITEPAPEGEGAARAMDLALKSAGLRPEEVQYINAHGTSTEFNDRCESQAIRTVFGDHASRLMVSSTKSMTGHLLGAAGAIEAVATVFSIMNGIVPPTINLENPDPECDLDYVPNTARRAEVEVALSNSFGFGGHNVSLAIRRYRG
ncbi:MAG: beta-ketoacyl-ACP synthase II [Candidatus Eisenbacteria bacterium]|nr:beta-ketoacyl-ACP synthase II [Candidatus Eisenbacteria bacterium]